MLTNPDCWKTCPNMKEVNEGHIGDLWTTSPKKINVKKVTKTVEKYGPDGAFLGKEIITEETYDEVPNTNPWDITNPYVISTDCTGSLTVNDTESILTSQRLNFNLNDVI